MRLLEAYQKLAGIHSIESVMDTLKVDKKRAIYYIHRLRDQGYVKTKKLSNNKRVYSISVDNKLNGKDYYNILNQHSPVKITTQSIYKIYGKEISLEETLVYAIKTKNFRTILASLALFKKINNWHLLYHLAKENHIERQVGALYDLSKKIIKVRRMSKQFRKNSLPKPNYKFKYIVPDLKSKEFIEIENIWKTHLPFNKADLEDYL